EPVRLLIAKQVRRIRALPRNPKIQRDVGTDVYATARIRPVALEKRVCSWPVPSYECRELLIPITICNMRMFLGDVAEAVGGPMTVEAGRTGEVVECRSYRCIRRFGVTAVDTRDIRYRGWQFKLRIENLVIRGKLGGTDVGDEERNDTGNGDGPL